MARSGSLTGQLGFSPYALGLDEQQLMELYQLLQLLAPQGPQAMPAGSLGGYDPFAWMDEGTTFEQRKMADQARQDIEAQQEGAAMAQLAAKQGARQQQSEADTTALSQFIAMLGDLKQQAATPQYAPGQRRPEPVIGVSVPGVEADDPSKMGWRGMPGVGVPTSEAGYSLSGAPLRGESFSDWLNRSNAPPTPTPVGATSTKEPTTREEEAEQATKRVLIARIQAEAEKVAAVEKARDEATVLAGGTPPVRDPLPITDNDTLMGNFSSKELEKLLDALAKRKLGP